MNTDLCYILNRFYILGGDRFATMHVLSLLLLQAGSTVAFPWVAGQPGVNSGLFRNAHAVEKRQVDCPFNPVHKGAAPYVAPYTYTGAKNGIPGSQKGGIKVPADGDKAHAFTPPGPNDIRGPCPGLNAAANVSDATISY